MVMREYVGNPQATAEAIDADGWFDTGDLAMMDEHGWIFIQDRAKDMIIRGGENVSFRGDRRMVARADQRSHRLRSSTPSAWTSASRMRLRSPFPMRSWASASVWPSRLHPASQRHRNRLSRLSRAGCGTLRALPLWSLLNRCVSNAISSVADPQPATLQARCSSWTCARLCRMNGRGSSPRRASRTVDLMHPLCIPVSILHPVTSRLLS